MDTVGVTPEGNFNAVVDDKRNAVFRTEGVQRLCLCFKIVLIQILFTDLQKGCPAF